MPSDASLAFCPSSTTLAGRRVAIPVGTRLEVFS